MMSHWRELKPIFGEYIRYNLHRMGKNRPLMKDPIALFSAPWLASKFDMDVIVLIRHPAAFVSTYKRRKWRHPFDHFLKQPLLMKEHLYPFEAEIVEYAEKEPDIIDESALLWKIIYSFVIKLQTHYSDWLFIRHEDISRNPLTGFENIKNVFNIEYSQEVIKKIAKYSDSVNPGEVPSNNSYDLFRNSKENIWNWKNRLTGAEIDKIRAKVEDVSSYFYSDEDW